MIKLKIPDILKHNFVVGLTIIVKAVFQLLLLKSISVYFGIASIGQFSQATSFVLLLQTLLCAGSINYIVSDWIKTNLNEIDKKSFIGTLTSWAFISLAVISLSFLIFGNQISQFVFLSDSYTWFFEILASVWIFIIFQTYFQGLLSSYKLIREIFISQALANLTSISLFVYFCSKKQFEIAIVSYLLVYLFLCLIQFYFLIRKKIIEFSFFRFKFSKIIFGRLAGHIFTIFVTGFLSTLYMITTRRYLIETQGRDWHFVGEWQSILKISEIMSSFLGLSIMTLYFPSLSTIKDLSALKKHVKDNLIKNSTIIFLMLAVLSIFAEQILKLVYSSEFTHLAGLLRLQFVGDFFRLSSWVFTYFFLSRLPLYVFLIFEALFNITIYFLTRYLSADYGLTGLIYAQNIVNISFFFVALLIYLNFINSNKVKL